MTRLKRAEIFLFDNGEDINNSKCNIKVMKKWNKLYWNQNMFWIRIFTFKVLNYLTVHY